MFPKLRSPCFLIYYAHVQLDRSAFTPVSTSCLQVNTASWLKVWGRSLVDASLRKRSR